MPLLKADQVFVSQLMTRDGKATELSDRITEDLYKLLFGTHNLNPLAATFMCASFIAACSAEGDDITEQMLAGVEGLLAPPKKH